MELNKNQSHRSDSAARLLDTPSDMEEEMIPLSESDEHLSTAISLRIDSSPPSENDHPVQSPTRTIMPFNIPLNGEANGHVGSKTSPNGLWPGSGHGLRPGSGHGLNGQAPRRPPKRGEVERPSTASSVIDLSEEIDERCCVRLNEESRNVLSRDTRVRIKPEIILAFLIAGLGNVAAGYMLAKVQLWNVFKSIPQLLILVQPLLGLKGNVEMTLASRLSTHSNLGDLDNPTDRNLILFGNMALIQCQASVVGFIAPIVAIILSFSSEYERESLEYKEMVLIVASSVITANVTNLILGTIMCCTIVLCRKYSINPDNIATPIAASLGDVTTLVLLAYISHWFFGIIADDSETLSALSSLSNQSDQKIPPQIHTFNDNTLLQDSLLILLMALIPLWAYLARTNPYTRNVIVTGWFPVCGAMLLQNAGGLIMERACEAFEKLAKFQPIINGVGGNLVAIQASRMSTHLHKNCVPKQLPHSDPLPCPYPGHTFFSGESAHTRMAQLLLLLAGPSHLVFLLITKFISPDFFLTPSFLFLYLVMSVLQVGVLLQSCDNFVHWLWSLGVDPDNTAIPFLTAIADFIGSVLLALTFLLLFQLGDPNAAVKITLLPTTDGADHPPIDSFIANLYNSSVRME